jgi:hypothetical protein
MMKTFGFLVGALSQKSDYYVVLDSFICGIEYCYLLV